MTDYTLQQRLVEALEASNALLEAATEQLGNARFYEEDAAKYLGVEKHTLYRYRQQGLIYEKVGKIISYRRKDLDAWRNAGKTKATAIY
ncbi:helix-turn-helix domain-containing protein [Spirosoma endbachense]|uniref:Helix-turn-helix domain-containing protein n=2 Tax=Spirosoma endbachense TaxID=2666025 RepID=A0A6P1W8F4_9BACT|nr:helix-turn-helix domain-containing protein [Spirosoma endbachense]